MLLHHWRGAALNACALNERLRTMGDQRRCGSLVQSQFEIVQDEMYAQVDTRTNLGLFGKVACQLFDDVLVALSRVIHLWFIF